jgi:hypothetical protein
MSAYTRIMPLQSRANLGKGEEQPPAVIQRMNTGDIANIEISMQH